MSLTTSEILERAAALIEPEGAWTQGESARDDNGDVVGYRNETAVAWCVLGAIDRISDGACSGSVSSFRTWLCGNLGEPIVTTWNDAPGRTQQEVVTALRDAAAAARDASGGRA